MAIREGRCKNCGSIIRVDDSKDDAVCLFCWAHTAPQEAIQIARNPDQYSFPNEPQDEPSAEDRDEALNMVSWGTRAGGAPIVHSAAPSSARKQKKGLTPAEKVAQSKKEIIEPKMSKRGRRITLAASLGAILLIAVISVPLMLTRESHRGALRGEMAAIYTMGKLSDANYQFSGQGNGTLTLVVPDSLTSEDTETIMRNFKKVRGKVYGLSENDPQNGLLLRIYDANAIVDVRGADVN